MSGAVCCCGNENDSRNHRKSDSRVSPEQLIGNSSSNSNSSRGTDEVVIIKRTCTDVTFLILGIAFTIVFAVLVSYCFVYGNIYRLLNGFDDCGNVCGYLNEKDSKLGCKGQDTRNEKYLLVEKHENPLQKDNPYIHRQCIERCSSKPGYRQFLNRCILDKKDEMTSQKLLSRTGLANYFQDISEDLSTCYLEIIYVCVISLTLSFIVLVMFRFVVGFVVWMVLLASMVSGVSGSIYLWIKYAEKKNPIDFERNTTYLFASILSTCVTIVICLVIFFMRSRVSLVICLFKEAGKALSDMPSLIFEPLVTFVALALTLALNFYITLVIESSGRLEVMDETRSSRNNVDSNMKIMYVKDGVMKATRWVNIFAMFWFTNFIFGCQDFIIGGAVSKWFFTRNKTRLIFPVLTSYGHLIRYHLGSICLGSTIIAIIQFFRMILKWIESLFRNAENQISTKVLLLCQCCLTCFDSIVQYLSKNAYILISMDGSSFCEAGKRAFQLLSKNTLQVLAINSIGDFVILLGKIFVVTCTVLIAIEMIQNTPGLHHPYIPIIVCGVFAFLVSHCFLTVFEMTIDTIFLCFCEDCEINDGINRPYYMSRGLMEFVQSSKQFKDKKNSNTVKVMQVERKQQTLPTVTQ